MTHSPEPWQIVRERISTGVLVDANKEFIAGYSSDEGAFSFDDPNYQRIVACVNACHGIPDERLVNLDLKVALEHLDNGHGNIDCEGYCPVAKALKRPMEIPT